MLNHFVNLGFIFSIVISIVSEQVKGDCFNNLLLLKKVQPTVEWSVLLCTELYLNFNKRFVVMSVYK